MTVVVAAYLRRESLRRAVASALAQTMPDLEVLVVCDAADDAYLAEVPREDRVRVLDLDRRAGGQYGPNSIGIRAARGEFIAFLNHDDLWLSDHLELALDAVDRRGSDLHQAVAAFIGPSGRTVPDGAGSERLRLGPVSHPVAGWETAR